MLLLRILGERDLLKAKVKVSFAAAVQPETLWLVCAKSHIDGVVAGRCGQSSRLEALVSVHLL